MADYFPNSVRHLTSAEREFCRELSRAGFALLDAQEDGVPYLEPHTSDAWETVALTTRAL